MLDGKRIREEPKLVYRADLSNIPDPKTLEEDSFSDFNLEAKIPWDVLSEAKQELIKLYIYDEKNFVYIAKKLRITNSSLAKKAFYRALNKLSEYATMRQFLEQTRNQLTFHQASILEKIYFDNKSLAQVAKEVSISRKGVQKIKSRVIAEHKIKWKVFVKKTKGKLSYNIPLIFKS